MLVTEGVAQLAKVNAMWRIGLGFPGDDVRKPIDVATIEGPAVSIARLVTKITAVEPRARRDGASIVAAPLGHVSVYSAVA